MCGIAGFVTAQTRPRDAAIVQGMVAAIRHRGPDDAGVYTGAGAGLGHARLSIIDVAGGAQPMAGGAPGLRVVFNGEIFNYLELRQELAARGHRFATHSDTEVLLHAYAAWGERCVERFNGQWAFALWDESRRRLFLSRDRLGVRPLFYTFTGGDFIFGSEIKALLAYPGVRPELDLAGLAQVFTFWHPLPDQSLFQGIHQLPPGSNAVLEQGRLRIEPYWDLRYPIVRWDGDAHSERALAGELLERLEQATRLRLRADVPVGAYLSGGLDSTLTTALARPFTNRLRTFSIRFEDDDLDEGRFQQEAARYLDTDHAEIRCTAREIGEVFPDVIWHAETPALRTAPAPLFLLSRLVHSSGFKVVITGEGSDELLGGYDIFKETKIRSFWNAHPDSAWRPALLKRLYPYIPNVRSQPAQFLAAFFDVRKPETQGPFFSHLPRWRQVDALRGFFSPELQQQLRGGGQARLEAPMQAWMPEGFATWGAFERAQYLEARQLLPGYILSSQGDRVAMAHAVEGRYPFLDPEVAAFAAQLDPRLKMKVLREKYLLKQAAAGRIPDSVLRRHKQPYRAPDARCFFHAGQPLDYVGELLSPRRIGEDGLFEPRAVTALLEKGRRGAIQSNRDNMALVGIVSTQLLQDRFVRSCSGTKPTINSYV